MNPGLCQMSVQSTQDFPLGAARRKALASFSDVISRLVAKRACACGICVCHLSGMCPDAAPVEERATPGLHSRARRTFHRIAQGRRPVNRLAHLWRRSREAGEPEGWESVRLGTRAPFGAAQIVSEVSSEARDPYLARAVLEHELFSPVALV